LLAAKYPWMNTLRQAAHCGRKAEPYRAGIKGFRGVLALRPARLVSWAVR
jgi:hypothetical protein